MSVVQQDPVELWNGLNEGTITVPQAFWAMRRLAHTESTLIVLSNMLKHDSPIVREGAIYALEQFCSYQAKKTLQDYVIGETDATLRSLAQSAYLHGDFQ